MKSYRIRAFWRLTEGHRQRYLAAIAALAVGTVLAYLIPLVSRATIDALLGDSTSEAWTLNSAVIRVLGGHGTLVGELWRATLIIGALALLSGFFMHLRARWAALATEGLIRQLRDRLYYHIQHLPAKYYDDSETGDIVQRCTSDVETIRHFLNVQVVEIGRGILLILTALPIMLVLDPMMTGISVIGAPLIVVFSLLFFRRIRPAFVSMEEAEGKLTTVLQENLTGIRVVRAFARQEYERNKFGEANRKFRQAHFHLIRLLAVYWPVSDVFVFGQLATVLLVGANRVENGTLSVGTLVAFLSFVSMYIWPIRQMGRILADLGKATVALGRVDEILTVAVEQDPVEKPGSPARPEPISLDARLKGSIQFNNVRFSYRENSPALRGVSFSIEPGETVALLGPSGSGKSTIVSLLLRLYDLAGPENGRILLDGGDLGRLPRKWIRSQISVVLQEPFLFSKTVRDNIKLSRSDAADQELHEAAQIAAIHDSILEFEKGYDTLVGERGVTLSGGQRQRVALARALLQRPAILILDDALSAVDTETESLILQALRERHGQQTTLLIAHRLSTLREADRVLVFAEGQLVQSGAPDELRQQPGLFRNLWEIQDELLAGAS